MDVYLLDWARLLLRWVHVVTAIAWIGASFYFVFPDRNLVPPTDAALRDKGVAGELWAVHGGGFYNPQKYDGAPPDMPSHLHWFYWKAYSTWLSYQLFAGRAALLMTGAMLATAMSASVLVWTIPGQRSVIAQMRAGQAVDPIHGQRAKQPSVHNTYFTLPVRVAMLANHCGWLTQGPHNWAVLVLLMLAGALIRQHAQGVYVQVAVTRQMPLNNATQISDDERALIKRWFEAGAPGQ